MTEINQYTDIKINWDTEKEGKRVVRAVFYMVSNDESSKEIPDFDYGIFSEPSEAEKIALFTSLADS